MVNSEEFVTRLERILKYYSMSASGFADSIGVQRSSISHLLTGRNKPSLEFVLKVVKTYPEVNLYWLLNGKGSFPARDTSPVLERKESVQETEQTKERTIKKIIVLYDDGSFESYEGLKNPKDLL